MAWCFLLLMAACAYGRTSLVPGDQLSCFNVSEGGIAASTVAVTGMPSATALDLKTGSVSATANAWDDRQRCFTTNATTVSDTVRSLADSAQVSAARLTKAF